MTQETHEPARFEGWQVGVELTPDDVGECIKITVHGVDHYVHSTTAMVLYNRLGTTIRKYNRVAEASGVVGVSFTDLELR